MKEFDLTQLNLSNGTHNITVKAKASGYRDSEPSNAVSYVVQGETYTVQLSLYGLSLGSTPDYLYPVYDGADTSGKYLKTININDNTTHQLQITSGYLTIDTSQGQTFFIGNSYGDFEYIGKLTSTGYIDGNAVFRINSDCEIVLKMDCFVEGTQITLADGNTKSVEDISYDDELLVWDFYNGKYATAKPFWIMRPAVARYYYKITLSNGDTVKLVGSGGNCHRVFSVTQNKFIYATQCVGDDIYTEKGIFKLVTCERVDEVVNYYNLKTEKYHNCFANGILTCGRYGNIYDIADMKYCSDIPNFTDVELAEREAHWERIRLPK